MLWFLLRLILLMILFLLIKRLWHALCGAVQSEGGMPPRSGNLPQTMVRDPECGLHLPMPDALTVHTEQGMLYFCSRECRDTYLARNKKIQ